MCKRPRRATAERQQQQQIQIQIQQWGANRYRYTHTHTKAVAFRPCWPLPRHLFVYIRCAAFFLSLPLLLLLLPPPTAIASCDRVYAACDDEQRVGRELRYSSWPPHTANYAYKMLQLQGVSVCPTVRVCVCVCRSWRVSATFGHFGHLTLTTRPATCDLTLAPKLSRRRRRSRRSSGS